MSKCCEANQNFQGKYLDNLVKKICATYSDTRGLNHLEGYNLPRQQEVIKIVSLLLEVIFPGFDRQQNYSMDTISYSIGSLLNDLYHELSDQIGRSFRYRIHERKCDSCDVKKNTEEAVRALLDAIPEIRETMKLDVAAAFDGDPAALSCDEIIVSYPGIRAITIQRLAHELYLKDVPLIPRMMTEYAHSKTGIDIHPGADLGKGIFIDHGTGVVIGETAKIGNRCRIYQGVTLGALSFPKDACGILIKGIKRHPTIGENVTIYAGATVLGDILVGDDCVIGGNVWLTQGLPPGTKISIAPPEMQVKFAKK